MNAHYLQEFVLIYDDTWLFKNKFIRYFEGGQSTKIKVSFQAKKKKNAVEYESLFCIRCKDIGCKKKSVNGSL